MPKGLAQKDADIKLKEYGYNEIQDLAKVTPLQILFRQVKKNFIVYLLVFAAIISFSVGKSFTSFTIILAVLMVIVIGFIQEYKAEEAISNLKKMILPKTIAYRDGKKREIPSSELVPGDLIVLGNGEKIPADCQLVEDYDIRVNESALTGESREISKKTNIIKTDNPESNKLFMGTYIVNGRCTAVVTHTGMNTKLGQIAHLITTADKELPLQDKVNQIAKYMISVAIIAAISTGILMFTRIEVLNSTAIIEILVLTLAIAVAAFPEGFPLVLITTLSVGAKRMSKQNAIVNRMSIIETLGETTLICSDKTGTITKGEMTVKYIYTGSKIYEVEGTGYVAEGNILLNGQKYNARKDINLHKLIESAIICTDAEIERTGDQNEYKTIGTPTESALLILGAKIGLFKESYEYQRISEMPFNSERKMMSVLIKKHNNDEIYVKGAPEVLLEKCDYYYKNGKETKLDKKTKEQIIKQQKTFADNAFRTLAIAYKNEKQLSKSISRDKLLSSKSSSSVLPAKSGGIPLDYNNSSMNYNESKLVFLGITAMEDPPREEVYESLKTANRAGIQVVMITGDNKNTAISVAKEIGLDTQVIEGNDLDALSDEELKIAIKEISIFARVRPDHKIRIVKAYKEIGEIVAMTGDGVNDAPALKEAHVGIAMGKNGTDVSRSASDLVLKDDNFATIVTAIAEGRTVFNNLRKFITYQLSCNFAEITVLFIGVLLAPKFGWEVPILVSIQILFMNLVTDNLPAITLGLNPTSKDIMKEKPRIQNSILNKVLIKLIIVTGSIMAFFTLVAYGIKFNLLDSNGDIARSTALLTLILLEIGIAFSFRSFRKYTLNRSLFVNKYLVIASFTSIFFTILILYTPLNVLFETVRIGLSGWIIATIFMFIGIIIMDIIKRFNLRKRSYVINTR